jgi:hypothetical protein
MTLLEVICLNVLAANPIMNSADKNVTIPPNTLDKESSPW